MVSDTHLPRFGRRLPRALVEGLRDARVELILHLGDFTDLLVVDLFEAIAPFDAVAGNNDGPEIRARFGRRKVIEVDGTRIGMTHGDEGPGRTTPERALRPFAGEQPRVDIVLFGHSHVPMLGESPRPGLKPLALLNPGSPTDKRRQPDYTYALLEIVGGQIRARIVRFQDRSVPDAPTV